MSAYEEEHPIFGLLGQANLTQNDVLQFQNGIIINAPSFWPLFLISQRILWPGLGAVKLKLLLLKTFWIKVFLMF
jgi:hypothetical protein